MGSGEANNLHFLKVASAKGPPVVGTGMLGIEVVDKIYVFGDMTLNFVVHTNCQHGSFSAAWFNNSNEIPLQRCEYWFV